jgi:hypothetical protein
MDWQQPAALGVVGVTLGGFLWARWSSRRKRAPWDAGRGSCGCGSGVSKTGAGLVVRGRRGERPTVEIR